MRKATNIPLDQKVVESLRKAVYRTWDEIAPDAYEFVSTTEDAMEFVLDAGRMHSVDPVAHKLVDTLCEQHGYDKVLPFLSRHLPLV